MSNLTIVGMAQFYNESTRLDMISDDFMKNVITFYQGLCDSIVYLDDNSTDDSVSKICDLSSERMKYGEDVLIYNSENAWARGCEVKNKIRLHNNARLFNSDVIISFDFDEIFPPYFTRDYLEELVRYAKSKDKKAFKFPWISLWFSEGYCRVDKLGQISPPRIWINDDNDQINDSEGLHQVLWPSSITDQNTLFIDSSPLLHYSSVNFNVLKYKILHYLAVNPKFNYRDLFTDNFFIAQTYDSWFGREIQRETLKNMRDIVSKSHSLLCREIEATNEA